MYPRDSWQIDPKKLPGVARFPVDQWKKDGKPCLDTAGWYALCCKIAMKDMTNLGGIFNIGEAYKEEHLGPELEAKRVRRL